MRCYYWGSLKHKDTDCPRFKHHLAGFRREFFEHLREKESNLFWENYFKEINNESP